MEMCHGLTRSDSAWSKWIRQENGVLGRRNNGNDCKSSKAIRQIMANIEKLADRSDRLRARHAALNLEHVRDSVVLRADAAFLSTYSGQLTWTLLVNLI